MNVSKNINYLSQSASLCIVFVLNFCVVFFLLNMKNRKTINHSNTCLCDGISMTITNFHKLKTKIENNIEINHGMIKNWQLTTMWCCIDTLKKTKEEE